MILITGAAGFIGTNNILFLNSQGIDDLILVDNFSSKNKKNQLKLFKYKKALNIEECEILLKNKNSFKINTIIHLGAITDTTCNDDNLLKELNIDFSKKIWEFCSDNNVKLIYASSAATYGKGDIGFNDDESSIKKLKPLNKYGKSKNDFDLWALEQIKSPTSWVGLKFFNVYGPYEDYKGNMASVVHWGLQKVYFEKKIKLFKSLNPRYKDGFQERDFIFVNDVIDIISFFMKKNIKGIFNVGTAQPRTFIDLSKALFASLNIPESIEYIELPKKLENIYQYYTCANMKKLRDIGYKNNFTKLEDGVEICKNHFLKNLNDITT